GSRGWPTPTSNPIVSCSNKLPNPWRLQSELRKSLYPHNIENARRISESSVLLPFSVRTGNAPDMNLAGRWLWMISLSSSGPVRQNTESVPPAVVLRALTISKAGPHPSDDIFFIFPRHDERLLVTCPLSTSS